MSPFNPFQFPHIVALLMEVSAYETLLSLRRISRRYRDLVDTELTGYVSAHPVMEKGTGKVVNVVFRSSPQTWARWSRKYSEQFVPGLHIPRDLVAWTDGGEMPASMVRVLALVSSLHLHPESQEVFAHTFLPRMPALQLIKLADFQLLNTVTVPTVQVLAPLVVGGTDGHVRFHSLTGIALAEGVSTLLLKVEFKAGSEVVTIPPARHPATLRSVCFSITGVNTLVSEPDLLAHLLAATMDPAHGAKYAFDIVERTPAPELAEIIRAGVRTHLARLAPEQVDRALAENISITFSQPPETEKIEEDAWPLERLRLQALTIVQDPWAKRVVEELEEALLNVPEPFSGRGRIEVEEGSHGLFVSDGESAKYFKLPLDEASASQVFGLGSSCGDDGGRQILPPRFSVSPDPIGLVLHEVSSMMQTGPLKATLSKLVVCSEGGSADVGSRSLGKGRFGTIVVCLPSVFAGGNFVVWNDDLSSGHAWEHRASCISWAFMHSACQYEAFPVTSGTMVLLVYQVFLPSGRSVPDPSLDSVPAALQAALDCPSLLPEGGVLALGFQQEYRAPPALDDATNPLVGSDAEWVRAVKAAGLSSDIVAVFDDRTFDAPEEAEDSRIYKQRGFVVTRNFYALHELRMTSMDVFACLDLVVPGRQVHWVTTPAKGYIENTYEWDKMLMPAYASVALFVWVGPPGDRANPDPDMLEE